jgi:hypothetical protein
MGENGAEDLLMSLTQLFQGFGSQLQEFIWRDAAKQAILEEIECLQGRIRAQETAVARQKILVERIQRRVSEQEDWADWLASRVELYLHVSDRPNAWQHALELDQVRAHLHRQRKQLQEHLHTYHEQQVRLDDLRQQLVECQSDTHSWT